MSDRKPNEQHYQIEANKTEMMALSERNNARTVFSKGKGLIHDRNCLSNRPAGASGKNVPTEKKGSAKCQLENRRYVGEEYEKVKQKEYLKPFMLVNKYVMACLFFQKRRNPFCDPTGTFPKLQFFLNPEDTLITSEMH